VTSKGYESEYHPMSPFAGIMDDGTPFLKVLKKLGIKRLWIGGLCLDYCVMAGALDAVKQGFKTILIKEATLPLDTSTEQEVLDKLIKAGVEII